MVRDAFGFVEGCQGNIGGKKTEWKRKRRGGYWVGGELMRGVGRTLALNRQRTELPSGRGGGGGSKAGEEGISKGGYNQNVVEYFQAKKERAAVKKKTRL